MENCNCCGEKITDQDRDRGYSVDGYRIVGMFECHLCGAVLGEDVAYGDYRMAVLPEFAPESIFEEAFQRSRYYDVSGVNSAGVFRVHGWFDPVTRYIVQTG